MYGKFGRISEKIAKGAEHVCEYLFRIGIIPSYFRARVYTSPFFVMQLKIYSARNIIFLGMA